MTISPPLTDDLKLNSYLEMFAEKLLRWDNNEVYFTIYAAYCNEDAEQTLVAHCFDRPNNQHVFYYLYNNWLVIDKHIKATIARGMRQYYKITF